jgi:catechol 2,3-dioxygenase-like lactoylglutathione lyase family enzyme
MGVALLGAKMLGMIPARDLGRVRAFYEVVLGLRFIRQDTYGVMMDFNGSPIRIQKVAEFTPEPFTILAWLVPDLATAMKALAARGVTFERFPYLLQDPNGIWTNTNGDRVAWFKDPEGNTLSVAQTASPLDREAFGVGPTA